MPVPKQACDFCAESPAVIYCRADTARLCLACDRLVHAANSVSSRHKRWPICDACCSAASSIHCFSCMTIVCSNCDFDGHSRRGDGVMHDRRPVEGFDGCPSAMELVGLVGGDAYADAKAILGDDDGVSEYLVDDASVWETVPVFSLGDLVVPTTADHGFEARATNTFTKHRNSACGKNKEELIRQIRELVKGEQDGICQQLEAEPLMSNDSWWMATPAAYEDIVLENNHSNLNVVKSTVSLADLPEYHENTPSTNTTFLNEPVEVPLTASGTNIIEADNVGVVRERVPPLPPKFGHELPCPDRSTVLSRYKEKRKTRRYDKLIRYESRKIRADSRMRIKGRFAKFDITNKQ